MNAIPEALTQVLTDAQAILLDFDGPVCSIFAGYPAPQVATMLRGVLVDQGVTLPGDVENEPDPLEVLRWTGRVGQPRLTRLVEDKLREAELHAAKTARPEPYAREVIVAARQAEWPLAVVSNNSAPAIAAYLAAHRLTRHIDHVVGRAYAEPHRMKPNPEPILQAATSLGVKPEACVLIGDSLADIEGGHAAGVPVVGYANNPHKVDRFTTAGAAVVVTTMRAVASALLALAL